MLKERRLPAPPIPEVFRRGRMTRSETLTLWSRRTSTGQRRAAVIVRSRGGRLKSCDRHRAQRRLREIVRRHQHRLAPSLDLLVVLACAPGRVPSSDELRTTFLAACTAQHLLNPFDSAQD